MNLPPITRSLRFRLSGWTSAVVFGIGGLSLAAIYFIVLRQIQSLTETRLVLTGPAVEIGSRTFVVPQEITEEEVRTVESVVRELILNRVAMTTLAVLVGLFLLSILVSWFVAGRALRPVNRITEVAREIEATDLTRRIALEGPNDELMRMATTFDGMLDRLDRAFQGQSRFLAQTSHDLRTPLAIIRSNVDVAMADPTQTIEDWRQTGEIVSRAAGRMSAMVEELLSAARLDNESVSFTDVDLAEVVMEASLAARATGRAREVEVESRATPVTVHGDRGSLVRAIGNLVDNAFAVAPAGSSLMLGSGEIHGWAYLAVGDRGLGIDLDLVESETGGARMGLSIVREIAKRHRGRLAGAHRPGGGSILVVWIPTEHAEGAPPDMDRVPVL